MLSHKSVPASGVESDMSGLGHISTSRGIGRLPASPDVHALRVREGISQRKTEVSCQKED